MAQRIGGVWAGLLVAAGIGAATAAAQPVSAPEPIRACLCLEQSLAAQAGEVAAARRDYERRREEAEALKREADSAKSRVNVNDPASIDAYRELLDRRDAATARYQAPDGAQYAALVQRYNDRVAVYNGQCGSQSFDAAALARAKQDLACPKE